ncbi:MAG: hypothetical protein KIS94_15650 [Chitinophagales bacterium]|nr:hypothetical protein [Chitinophagales bacterium]
MNTIKTATLIAVFFVVFLSASSCSKIQEDAFIKGFWKLNELYFDTMQQNQMPVYFPGFTSTGNCCVYKLDFEPDAVIGYYLVNNTFQKVTIGNWEITKYNQILLQVDSFADGIFDIKKTTIKKYELTSENNHVKFLDTIPSMDSTYTKLIIERI